MKVVGVLHVAPAIVNVPEAFGAEREKVDAPCRLPSRFNIQAVLPPIEPFNCR